MLKVNKLRIFWFCIVLQICISTYGQYRHSYLQLGKMELWKENYVESINFFTYYIKDHPNIYEGYYLRGLAKYYLTDLLGSELDLARSIRLLPEFPRLYMVRGIVRSENFKLQQALDDFDEAIGLDSSYTEAYFYKSLSHLVLHKYESALVDINHVIELDTIYPNVFILRGVIHAQLQNFDEAIRDFTKCIEQNPENSRALIERGSAYAKLRQTDFAMADIDSALSLDSLNAYAYFQRGLIKIEMMEYESALEDLNRVIEISPENELAYFNRALINSNKDLDDEAIDDFIHILNQNPDNMLVYYNMGISLARMGQYDQAINSFNSAIELFPDYADAYYQLALVKKEIGDIESAKQDLLIYESLNEKNLTKDDSTKFKEGLQLLRLSHLSNDFIREEEKKHKVQYMETEIDLQPIFQAIIDSSFFIQSTESLHNNEITYKLKSIQLTKVQTFDVEFMLSQIHILDSLIIKDEHNMNYYLKRGLLNNLLKKSDDAILDFNNALSYAPRNTFLLFSRANARISSLQDLLYENSWAEKLSEHHNSNTLRVYSDILHDLHKVLEIDPDFLYARYNIGYCRFMMEDYSGALAEFSIVAKKRKIAEAHFNKALLQIFMDQNENGCIELGIAGELGLKESYAVIRKFCN